MEDYPFQPISFTDVTVKPGFWHARIETNRDVTIPYDFQKCEETARIDNFDIAAGKKHGKHTGLQFNDSDLFKIIEGAAYSLHVSPDAELEGYIDTLIEKIADAQEPDGYIYTARTIDPEHPHETAGPERWSSLVMSHELYNVGHMYEGAVAYYLATGKRAFLDLCIKNADLLCEVFGPDGLRRVPGHQEVELGLVKLYRVTGEEKYLKLAKFFLDERGHENGRTTMQAFGNPGYMQDHIPVIEQREAVGHSVRATYMYSAMADVAALTQDVDYVRAMRAIWENVVYKKLALTGGIGAQHTGEAFGEDYELPNLTSYNETCAAIGSIYWNHRLFLLEGQSRYYDIIERTLYNGFLSGIALEGNKFFYVNPLEFDGEYRFNRDNSLSRQPWFSCSCCPTNVVRLLPSLPGYIYAQRDDRLFTNLYMNSQASVNILGTEVEVTQETNYPWDGNIKITVSPSTPADFTLSLRVPCWANGQPLPGDLYTYLDGSPSLIRLKVNGQDTEVNQQAEGYIDIQRKWQAGDRVEIDFNMPIRRVLAHEKVAATQGKVAIERGPLVYAVEGVDTEEKVLDLELTDHCALSVEFCPDLLGGINVIKGEKFTAVPYYAWGHRGVSPMAVWLKRAT